MKNLIEDPNYTQVPNIVLDHWQAVLTPSQFSVLLCICRETFGYHRQREKIPLSLKEIVRRTNISLRCVESCLDLLIKNQLIEKFCSARKDGGCGSNFYKIYFKSDGSDMQKLPPPTALDAIAPYGINCQPNKERESINKEEEVPKGTSCGVSVKNTSPTLAQGIAYNCEKQAFEGIEQKDIEAWKSAYPNAQVEQQLLKIVEWLKSNSTKAKQKKQWRRFITNWLSREEDKSFSRAATGAQKQLPAEMEAKKALRQKNQEVAWRAKKYLEEFSLEDGLVIGSWDVEIKSSGDAISYDLPNETFKQIITKAVDAMVYVKE